MSRRKAQHKRLMGLDQDESSEMCFEYREDAQLDDGILKTCHYCHEEFSSTTKRIFHERYCREGSIERHSCKICKLNFKFLPGLQRHEKRHEPPGGFICGVCSKPFTTDEDRNNHRNTEHKVYKCQICEERFGTEAEYVAHIVNEHGGKDREPIVCNSCGQMFRSQAQLKIHTDSKCGTVKMYPCDECNSRFMTSSTLKAHKLIHLGEKKHLCNYCGNSFLSKGQLKVHERSHTGEKPFKCDECGKAFAYRESLVTHSSLHTGIKPYVCELCGKRFSCIGNLIKHRRSRPDTCGLPQFRRNSKATPRPKASRSRLANKLMELVEREEISVEHQVDYVTNEDDVVPQIKEEKEAESEYEEIEYLNDVDATTFPEEEPEDKPTIAEVIIHSSGELDDMDMDDDNVPLSQLKSQVVTEDHKVFVTEVEVIPAPRKPISPPKRTRKQKKTEPKKKPGKKALKSKEKEVVEMEIVPKDINDSSDTDYYGAEDRYSDESGNNYEVNEEGNSSDDYTDGESGKKKKDKDVVKTSMVHEYKCDHCPKMFCYKSIFKLHLKKEHNIDVPEEELPNQHKYSKILFPRDRIHECKYCKRKYANKPALLKHQALHGPDGNLHVKCRVCKEYFQDHDKEKEHRLLKHKDKITCKDCNKMYRDENHLQVHIRNCHSIVPVKKNQHLCGRCGKSFTSKTAMLDHERSDCGKSPIYQCNVCKKFYHSAGSLKTHRNIHDNVLPNLCKYCGKGFRTQGQLKVHERIHTGEKPFACTYCPKAFSHRESLLTHLSLHTGFKRFMCSGCGQRFTCISNLQAHRKAHADTCGRVPNCTKSVGPMDIHSSLKHEQDQE
ncbi:uncharacterized protein DMENIID0001_034480 [Sergentomyia squamirostris]